MKKKGVLPSKKLSRLIRRDILEHSYRSSGAHISSCLSIADILAVLYAGILRINPKSITDSNRDRFILSKGHAGLALYCTLANLGFFPKSTLKTYLRAGSTLTDHPEYGLPGVELATGSLGHGLSVGAGMALASKIDRKNYRVFVLVSDAELNEGSTWEAIQFASHNRLDNLVVVVDANGLQAFGKTKEVLDLTPLEPKFLAFGFATATMDGHDHTALLSFFQSVPLQRGKPSVVIAETVAGKGISFMEGELSWHYRNLTPSLYKKAMEESS